MFVACKGGSLLWRQLAICPRLCHQCEHLALVQAQVGFGCACRSWEVCPGPVLLCLRPLTTCFAGTGSQASEDVVPRRLESQKEAKGGTPYSHTVLPLLSICRSNTNACNISSCCMRLGCSHQMSDTGEGAFCSPRTDGYMGMSLTSFTIQSE